MKYLILLGIFFTSFPILGSKKYKVLAIIRNQINNFSDFENNQLIKREAIGFFLGPLLIVIGLVNYNLNLNFEGLNILLTLISIMTGLLISSLIGINSLDNNSNKKIILIASNYIVFSIFITIIIFTLAGFKIFNIDFKFLNINFVFPKVVDGGIFYLFILYVLNIFLILKKIMQIFDLKS